MMSWALGPQGMPETALNGHLLSELKSIIHIPSKFSFLTWDIGSKIVVRMLSLGASFRKSMTRELKQSQEVPTNIIGSAQLCQEPGSLPLLRLALASSLC